MLLPDFPGLMPYRSGCRRFICPIISSILTITSPALQGGSILGPLAQKLEQRYTYREYLAWDEDERWELIDGIPYDMTPTPGRLHQKIAGNIYRKIADFLDDRPCEVYIAPFDVRLPLAEEPDEEITTVVQPDIVVVCDELKLDDAGCRGAPDLVVEVLSPSTARKDLKEKLNLYESRGVREYWIVNPDARTVMVFHQGQPGSYGRPMDLCGRGEVSGVCAFRAGVGSGCGVCLKLEKILQG